MSPLVWWLAVAAVAAQRGTSCRCSDAVSIGHTRTSFQPSSAAAALTAGANSSSESSSAQLLATLPEGAEKMAASKTAALSTLGAASFFSSVLVLGLFFLPAAKAAKILELIAAQGDDGKDRAVL